MPAIEATTHRGWEVLHLASELIAVDLVPGKGGDVTSLRWRPLDVDVLWHTPWGLRTRGEHTTAGSSEAMLMQAYPGGWQTVFPNGGAATTEHGVEWGMHGEAWLASYDWQPDGDAAVVLHTELVRSPFSIAKRVAVDGASVTVAETVTNRGAEPIDVMWSQHPSFGPPLLAPGTRIETAATTVYGEDLSAGAWPKLPGTGDDLTLAPGPNSGASRLAFLPDVAEGRAAIVNDTLGLRADLAWDATLMPHVWYWLEAGGRSGFPWYSDAYVVALEPATSYPATGVSDVRDTTRTHLTIRPGETRTSSVTVTLAAGGSDA